MLITLETIIGTQGIPGGATLHFGTTFVFLLVYDDY